jgi:hypothetical protein
VWFYALLRRKDTYTHVAGKGIFFRWCMNGSLGVGVEAVVRCLSMGLPYKNNTELCFRGETDHCRINHYSLFHSFTHSLFHFSWALTSSWNVNWFGIFWTLHWLHWVTLIDSLLYCLLSWVLITFLSPEVYHGGREEERDIHLHRSLGKTLTSTAGVLMIVFVIQFLNDVTIVLCLVLCCVVWCD